MSDRTMRRSLTDVTSLLRRGTAPSYVDHSDVRVVGQRCVQTDGFRAEAARPHSPRALSGSLVANFGDVLLNSTGAGTIGRSCVFNVDGTYVVDSHVTVLRARPDIVEPRWIDLILRSPAGQRYLESHCFVGSTNQTELSRSELGKFQILTPPIVEQRRIISALDDLLGLKKSIGSSIAKWMNVRRGELDRIFGCGADGHDYSMVPLESVAQISGGVTLGASIAGIGGVDIPYMRVANVQDGYIDTRDMKSIRVTATDVQKFRLKSGDVLLTEGGDLDKLGRGGVWDGRIDPCLHQNHIFRVRCFGSKMIPEYLALYLMSRPGRNYFMSVAKQTTNLASVSLSQVKVMPVPRPSISEQARIVELFASYDLMIKEEQLELSKLERVEQGVLMDALRDW
ncbi:restriction endonuclease subunit S [Streptomyces sudanensis]|uniref:restriction endonuclease subunit S n=2 Tax=Streptomyces sudanensis TaxID=436397 RepID=UPI0027E456A0|nr:restriction endonuclease subunit S [Streptomyces sudanensis]